MDEQSLFTPFDEKTQTKELQILKTILPYLPPSRQRTIVFFIYFLQARQTEALLTSSELSLQSASLDSNSNTRLDMLNALKKFCSPREQETIDTILNMLSVMENYDALVK